MFKFAVLAALGLSSTAAFADCYIVSDRHSDASFKLVIEGRNAEISTLTQSKEQAEAGIAPVEALDLRLSNRAGDEFSPEIKFWSGASNGSVIFVDELVRGFRVTSRTSAADGSTVGHIATETTRCN